MTTANVHPVEGTVLYGAPSPTLEVLLDDPTGHDFVSASRFLSDLSEEMALARPANLPYSIAEIVAHLISNARFNLGLIDHPAPQTFEPPLPDWPAVHAGEWDTVRQEYFHVLQQLQEMARQPDKLAQVVYPATSEEPGWTVGYKLTCSVAKHAAYHMGQIVVIRRLLGVCRDELR